MTPIGNLLILLTNIFVWIVIIDVILGWLINFDVINRGNNLVRTVQDFTHAITEPCLRPIRRTIPPIGGLDLSPLVLIIAVWIFQALIRTIGL